ncbi:MAG: c-type cytochrome [Ferruginibacter sp.]
MTSIKFVRTYLLFFFLLLAVVVGFIILIPDDSLVCKEAKVREGYEWNPPDTLRIPATVEGELIRYGKSLVVNTSFYLGPNGKIAHTSNGMNCQNCHLEAGTRFWGNNYGAVFSTYPKFRTRSGTIESIYKRINDCFERSLNGTSLDTTGKEMQAMYAYIKWLGRQVPKNNSPVGSGIVNLPFLSRAADPKNGQTVYIQKCIRCHGIKGAGLFNTDSSRYVYPPLWGDHSYSTGAGLFRISRLAGYIKYNMPLSTTGYDSTQISNEEAWDVAAFINSQPRPIKEYPNDWPDISAKPIDHPFGPYTDSFSELQHKYGPFAVIEKAAKKSKK